MSGLIEACRGCCCSGSRGVGLGRTGEGTQRSGEGAGGRDPATGLRLRLRAHGAPFLALR